MKKAEVAIKWRVKHTETCEFLPGQQMFMTDKREWHDKIGRGDDGMHVWRVFRCNDPDCEAKAIVLESDISELLFPSSAETGARDRE